VDSVTTAAGKDKGRAVSTRKRIASTGLPQILPSHWLRVVALLITLMIAGAGWDQTQAGSPRTIPHGA
jgi:hypothetical protein